MALMRQEIDKEAKKVADIELLMNDSQNAQSIQTIKLMRAYFQKELKH